jgi:fumarate hydratase class II
MQEQLMQEQLMQEQLMQEQLIQEQLMQSFSLVTTLGEDLSQSEREEIIKKAYMSSLAVKDFVSGKLDLGSFLDIQQFCLTNSSIDDYLGIVNTNIESLSFAELLIN